MSRPDGGAPRLPAWVHSRLLKAAVSALLIGLLLWRVDTGEIAATLGEVSWGLLALGAGIFIVTNLVSAWKWGLVIRAQGDRVAYGYLAALFYIGLFFNNFLPTNFGGDVVKAFKLSRMTGRAAEAAGSVVIDRVTSTIALLTIAAVPALFELRLLGARMALIVLAMLLAAALIVAFFASERFARRLSGLRIFSFDPMGVRRHLKSFYYALHDFRRHRGTLAAVMLVSLVYQGLQIITVYVLALSLGIEVSLIYYFLFIPIVLAVGMLPVSLNGLGVREGAWVLLFGQVGVASAQAFTMSVLSFFVMTVVSLLGGFFYLFDRALPAAGASEAETGAGNG
ncbi:MAG: UPF0104 family protein [Gaiellales bacterium]|nr:MAG: UPF0104 family protein [Gaiellales bacterium]